MTDQTFETEAEAVDWLTDRGYVYTGDLDLNSGIRISWPESLVAMEVWSIATEDVVLMVFDDDSCIVRTDESARGRMSPTGSLVRLKPKTCQRCPTTFTQRNCPRCSTSSRSAVAGRHVSTIRTHTARAAGRLSRTRASPG